jgi:hypothetical protein
MRAVAALWLSTIAEITSGNEFYGPPIEVCRNPIAG